MSGPLHGIRAVELGGIGPGPFAAMVMADMGADVVRIERPGAPPLLEGLDADLDVLRRGRRELTVDLKSEAGRRLAQRLVTRADVLIDPFRPGTTERLGLGPAELCELNPRLVYARATGWGQEGPLSRRAGHDINYVALAGPLAAIGRADSPPPPPLNLIGDFGGGGMLVALGVALALVERASSGRGQVIDAAMIDGVALQFASIMGFRAMRIWEDRRESNSLDGGAPFYDCYQTADGGYMSVGALEPQFYAELLDGVGLAAEDWPQNDRDRWPALKRRLSQIFGSRTREEWEREFAGRDACVVPVLGPSEAAAHPHNAGRGLYVTVDDVLQPAPAPRFSRTPGRLKPREQVSDDDWGLPELAELSRAPA